MSPTSSGGNYANSLPHLHPGGTCTRIRDLHVPLSQFQGRDTASQAHLEQLRTASPPLRTESRTDGRPRELRCKGERLHPVPDSRGGGSIYAWDPSAAISAECSSSRRIAGARGSTFACLQPDPSSTHQVEYQS